uniref:Uncharacterized protein n=1 Tax=Triticum urartu TaxID=4572 RepID=A0A8R7TGL5_TRIUA
MKKGMRNSKNAVKPINETKYQERHQNRRRQNVQKKKKRYANMQIEKKKARMEQIEAHRQSKRNTPSKDSIAMKNPEYVATEQEESTSTFTVKHRDHVAAGERQALLHRRNEEFTRRHKQAISVSSKEDESMTEICNENTQPLEQPQVMTYDIPSLMFPSIRETDTPTQSLYNDDHSKVTMWKDIPCTMLPTIKEVHARIQSLCNDGIIYEQEETIKEIDAAAKSMCNEDQGSGAQQFRFTNGLDLIHLLSLYERKLNRDKSLEVKGASTSTNNQSVTALTGGGGTDSVRLHMGRRPTTSSLP